MGILLIQGSLYTTQYTWRLLLATLPSPSDPVFCVIRAGRIADAQLDSMSIRQHQVHAASSVHDGSAWGVAAPHAIWPVNGEIMCQGSGEGWTFQMRAWAQMGDLIYDVLITWMGCCGVYVSLSVREAWLHGCH